LHTSAPFDGTKWGHIAIQQLDAEEMDAKILNTPVLSVGKERKEMDELRCANLVVTTPDSERGKKLPVIVWAHGGAYKVGSANFAAYDTVNIVRHSVEIGMPVVVISINRRLNSLGSTATPELGRSTESGNWLLKDEKCALEWVCCPLPEGEGG
jgi:carboxylesterase type B